jgi:hypothetical protein
MLCFPFGNSFYYIFTLIFLAILVSIDITDSQLYHSFPIALLKYFSINLSFENNWSALSAIIRIVNKKFWE